eukprot:3141974-Amphidinium_carterae.1
MAATQSMIAMGCTGSSNYGSAPTKLSRFGSMLLLLVGDAPQNSWRGLLCCTEDACAHNCISRSQVAVSYPSPPASQKAHRPWEHLPHVPFQGL